MCDAKDRLARQGSRWRWALLPFSCGVLLAAAGCAHNRATSLSFPPDAHGWTPTGARESYDAQTLYDYINGAAEVYRALNVQQVLARRYAKPGAPEIVADIYDMGTAEDAFGAYHHDPRQGESVGIGRESEYIAGSLSFWKGRFFVSVVVFDEVEDARQAVLALGRDIAEALADEGEPPWLAGLLPEEGLLAEQVHYFHTHLSLTAHFYLADENVLALDATTQCVLAHYKPVAASPPETQDPPFVLLLVRYPSRAAAQAAFERFRTGYMPGLDNKPVVQTGDGLWMGARLEGDLFVGVFDAPAETELQRVMLGVTHNLAGNGTGSPSPRRGPG